MANEKRLIDANALKERIYEEPTDGMYTHEIIAAIDEQPTVDAVEVVRCKDCVHMKKQFNGRFCDVWCLHNGDGDEGFCNYGERRTE